VVVQKNNFKVAFGGKVIVEERNADPGRISVKIAGTLLFYFITKEVCRPTRFLYKNRVLFLQYSYIPTIF